jgi:hypothetical protein
VGRDARIGFAVGIILTGAVVHGRDVGALESRGAMAFLWGGREIVFLDLSLREVRGGRLKCATRGLGMALGSRFCNPKNPTPQGSAWGRDLNDHLIVGDAARQEHGCQEVCAELRAVEPAEGP